MIETEGGSPRCEKCDSYRIYNGLIPMSRLHVHSSSDIETAMSVGKRHTKTPVVLAVNINKMIKDKYKIYKNNIIK